MNRYNSLFDLEQELDKMNRVFKDKDDFLGKDCLVPNCNKANSSRLNMFNSHIDQALVINEAELPRIFTGYESQIGSFSNSIVKAKDNFKVISKISKYLNSNFFYLLLVQYEDGTYDIIERKEIEHYTEHFGFKYVNDNIDKIRKDFTVNKGRLLSHAPSYDRYENFGYGKNAKAAYLIDNDTIEDAIVVSQSFTKKMIATFIDEVEININDNDVLCYLYSDKEGLKNFPDIGEDIKDKILLSRRRIAHDNILFEMSIDSLKSYNINSDTVFFSEGKVVDIEIFSNKTTEQLMENPLNFQIVKYLKQQDRFYKTLYRTLKSIVMDKEKKYTENLGFWYKITKEYLNPKSKWHNNNSDFNNVVMIFKVMHDIPLNIGSKLSGRYGK